MVLARALREPLPSAGARGCTICSCCLIFVEKDFGTVVADLNRAGYALESEWFAPHVEFRFPVYGRRGLRRHGDRTAPGHRTLVRAGRGAGRRRHGALCRFLPGASSGARARIDRRSVMRWLATAAACRCSPPGRKANTCAACAIAPGSRRAACIRPFRSTRRWCSIWWIPAPAVPSAAARYHVAHPGGRSYETFPVNSNEAEARRKARFFAFRPYAGSHAIAGKPNRIPNSRACWTFDDSCGEVVSRR